MGVNHFQFDGAWHQIKGQLRQKYAMLTDHDLEFIGGTGEELLGRLQSKLGLTEAALVDLLNGLKKSVTSLGHGVREKVSEATARVGEVVGDVKARVTGAAGEAYEHARESAHTLQGKAQDFVTQQPFKALLMAVAAGFIAGVLIRR